MSQSTSLEMISDRGAAGGSGDVDTQGGNMPTVEDEERANEIKLQRRRVRGKFNRSVNRVKDLVSRRDVTERRLALEMREIRSDFKVLCDLHGQLYDLVKEDSHHRLDKWENDLSAELFSLEELVEDYIASIQAVSQPHWNGESGDLARDASAPTALPDVNQDTQREIQEIANSCEDVQRENPSIHREMTLPSGSRRSTHDGPREETSFDAWVDDLEEFKETNHQAQLRDISIAEALYKLEASKDIPIISLSKFDGNPLDYIIFLENFKINVHDKYHLTDNVRMAQLRMHLTGEAERAISGLSLGGVMYATALKMIKSQFGQPSVIARAYIRKITMGPRLNGKDRESLKMLSLDIVSCIAALRRIQYLSDVNAVETLRQVIRRLPDFLILKWKSSVVDIREHDEVPTLEHISKFLCKAVRSMFDPDFGDLLDVPVRSESKDFRRERRGIHAAQPQHSEKRKIIRCYVCTNNHVVSDCPTFNDASVSERYRLVKSNRLCFACLLKGHVFEECRVKRKCGVNGCPRKHHELLHTDPPSANVAKSTLDKAGILPVIRVNFRSVNGHTRQGNVLIDSGAATTIIRKEFARALGLQGRRQRLELFVVGGDRLQQNDSRRVKFWISSLNGGEEFEIEAHEIDRTAAGVAPLDRHWLSSFPHLADIEFAHKAGPIDLILGVQYSHLHADEEVRQGLPFEPLGKLTRLGWYVMGTDGNQCPPAYSINLVEKVDYETFYNLETLGIRVPGCKCVEAQFITPDDRVAMEIFETTCHKDEKEGRYIIGLPWKGDPNLLPNNYSLAAKRLSSLEKSLKKNQVKAEMYDNAIKEYVNNRWAVEVNAEEQKMYDGPVYYLPHHGVVREDKPSTPLRVVFDPACSFKGASLNSLLLKGPCLIGNLLGVLLRFRENNIAFAGDISKMFLQILLSERDSHVHRFLWRSLDSTRSPDMYRLTRVTFGDKPSPDMASFVLLKLANEEIKTYPDVADILKHDRYMDDLVHSCCNVKDAVEKINNLDAVLAKGSFRIKEWITSSQELRDTLRNKPCQTFTSEVDSGEPDIIKTLGIYWNCTSDTIQFRVKETCSNNLTKRIVLSRLSMIYDPLGLVSAVTIRARVAVQAIWRRKELGWDDPLPADLSLVWQELFRQFKELESVQFPRCLRPHNFCGDLELHVFADASSVAYGAVAYLLWPTVNGNSVRLVSAKARVAPLRQTTIPRLELMAALVACRLAKIVFDELREKPTVFLWSDSQVVLHWIHSESVLLKPFVGIRVAEIQSSWKVETWRYVPSSMNPADDLSRGLDARELSGRWTNGPPFLKQPKEKWPERVNLGQKKCSEFRENPLVCLIVRPDPLFDCARYSSWTKLLRITTYCLRFIANLKSKTYRSCGSTYGELQQREIQIAENYWIRMAQHELGDWRKQYRDLCPFEQDTVVRVGGRLKRSSLPYEQIHPILLPSSSYISKLILRDFHQKFGHPGPERTLCESRRKYWILGGRRKVKEMVRSDEKYEYPRANLNALSTLGLLGLIVPTELGGLGKSHRTAVMVVETIARYGCPSTALVYVMHLNACAGLLYRHHNNALVKDILRKLDCDKLVGTQVTSDPSTGSHIWYPLSSKCWQMDDGTFKLLKFGSWATSAGYADWYLVQATSPGFNGDYSNLSNFLCFKDEVRASCGEWSSLGMRGNQSGPVVAEGLLDQDRLIGPPGDGVQASRECSGAYFLLLSSVCWNGVAMGCVDLAKKHVTRKGHFDVGMRICDYPTIQDYFGESILSTNTCRLSAFSLAQALDEATSNNDWSLYQSSGHLPRSNFIHWLQNLKFETSKNVASVSQHMLHSCGGTGYKSELGLERLLRDGLAGWVMGPSNEYIRQTIGKIALLGRDAVDPWAVKVDERKLTTEVKRLTKTQKEDLVQKLLYELRLEEENNQHVPQQNNNNDFDNPFSICPPRAFGCSGQDTDAILCPNKPTSMKLAKVESLTADGCVAKMLFESVDKRGHLGTYPGQYVKILVPEKTKQTTRYMSPTSPPSQTGQMEIVVRYESQGVMAEFLRDLTIGSKVEFQGPCGGFEYEPNSVSHLVLLCGGIGVTPAIQIVRSIASDATDQTKVTLLYQAKDLDQLIFKAELDVLSKDKRINVVFILQEPHSDWEWAEGCIGKDLMETSLPEPNGITRKVVICGGTAFTMSCLEGLMQLRYKSQDVFVYGPFGVQQIQAVYGRNARLSSQFVK